MKKTFLKPLLLAVTALLLNGCASIVNDTTYGVKIVTKTSTGTAVAGAECKISNDYGTTTVKSGETSLVHRSSKDLDIVCNSPNQAEAIGRAISRANAGLAGNIIFGGGIGAIIDHNRGTAYTYPTWMELVFGRTLVFDRRTEREGAPVQSVTPEVYLESIRANNSPSYNQTSTACSQGAQRC